MWKRFAKLLRCAVCKGELNVLQLDECRVKISHENIGLAKKRGVLDEDFPQFIETGLLTCADCRTWYPIARGLPVLLPYVTPLHRQFSSEFHNSLFKLGPGYHPPAKVPVTGEQFIMNSFSQEWQDYQYDGVLWDQSYEDLEKTFLSEMGYEGAGDEGSTYLEVGCGLGVVTCFAHKNFRGDAIGVDLSIAALKASQHYRDNPFLHFVQASAFCLPFKEAAFDLVYSRGVLMFAYSTRDAFRAIAPYCKPGGRLYVWIYGPGSVEGSLLRRAAYAVEAVLRPVLSRRPSSPFATAVLSCTTAGYLAYNVFDRLRNPNIQPFNYQRALHSARDRFTHRYAHRHEPEEVLSWFREAGFSDAELVDWRDIPSSQQENFKRNIGARGRRGDPRSSVAIEAGVSASRPGVAAEDPSIPLPPRA
jgi:SAM-dependent methyltransferase/uncharacterized protein YbaR (Trm112 family)